MKLLVYLSCLICIFASSLAFADDASPSVLVNTIPLAKKELTSQITGYGFLTPEPDKTLNLNFPISGRVNQVFVNPGQLIHKGELLLTVSPDASISLSYKQAKNALNYARAELVRKKRLFHQQLATRSQLDQAIRNLKDAKDAMASQKRLGAGASLNKLTASISGIVTAVSAVPGDRFTANSNLIQIANVDTLRARLGVEPSDSRYLRPGLSVRLSSVLNNQKVASGEVVWVAGQINPQTQLVDVSVHMKAQGFVPGTRVRGDIVVNHQHDFAVPRQAVLNDENGSYIFQVLNGVAHRINVTTGLEDHGWVAVQGPFLENAPVVTLGNYELEDGSQVRETAQ